MDREGAGPIVSCGVASQNVTLRPSYVRLHDVDHLLAARMLGPAQRFAIVLGVLDVPGPRPIRAADNSALGHGLDVSLNSGSRRAIASRVT